MNEVDRMPRLRLQLAGLALGAMAAVGVWASSAPQARADMPKLDIGISTTWWGHIPIMVAIDKGYFKELGVNV